MYEWRYLLILFGYNFYLMKFLMSVAFAKESLTSHALMMAIETFEMNRSPLSFVRGRKKSGHVQPERGERERENTLFLRFSSNNSLDRGQRTHDNKYRQF